MRSALLRPAVRAVAAIAVAACGLAACAAGGRQGAVPDPDRAPDFTAVVVRDRPEMSAATEALLREARRAASRGRRGDAVEVLQRLLADEPRTIEAHRLLQDLLATTRADAWLRARYPAPRPGAPADADASYLAARIEPDRERQTALFEEALAADPGHPWAGVGRAMCLERAGRVSEAVVQHWRVAASAPWLPLPWLNLGSTALARGAPEAAERFLRQAIARDLADPRPWGLLAAAYEDLDRPEDASRAAVEALRRAPGDPAVLWTAGRLLERRGGPEELAGAAEVLAAAAGDCGDPAALRAARGRLLLAAGDPAAAESVLIEARRAGAPDGDTEVPLRRARIAQGRASEAVEGYLARLPVDPTTPDDACAPAWAELRRAAQDASSGPDAALRLVRALASVGWLDEAGDVVAAAAERFPGAPDVRRQAADLQRFRAFLGDVGRLARDVRRRELRGTSTSLEEALASLGAAGRERMGVDVSEGAHVRSFPLLGAYVSSEESAGPFHEVFAARGLLLVVGARSGRTAELLVGRRVSDRRDRRAQVFGEAVEYDEHWIESDGLPEGLAGLKSGLAGLTVGRFVVMQLDVVRRDAPADDASIPFLARAAHTDEDLRALDTPSDVAGRIVRQLAAGGGGVRAVADAVVQHERVHVYDAARLLPIWRHPVAAFLFGLAHGFSGAEMEQTLEARAAVGALAACDEPRAALASLLAFLPAEDGATAHVAGYRDAVAAAVDEIVRDPASFPSIDLRWNVVQQMDRLTSDECRELGRRLLAR